MLPFTRVAADSISAWSIRDGSRKQQISCRQLGSTFFRALTTWANSGATLCRGEEEGREETEGREQAGERRRMEMQKKLPPVHLRSLQRTRDK